MEGRDPATRLDPEYVAASYEKMRGLLVESVERENRQQTAIDRRREWLARRPNAVDEQLHDRIGMRHEEVEALLAAESDAYREYYRSLETERTQAPRIEHPLGPSYLKLQDPDAILATPYAVLGVASDRAMLRDDFIEEEIHNPYAQKQDINIRRPLFVDLWGSGSGLYDWSFLPEYDTVRWAEVSWVHLYDPKWNPGSNPNWSYYAHVWFHGTIACWSDDSWWNSREAGIDVTTSVITIPVSIPQMTQFWWLYMPSASSWQTIGYKDDNINLYHTDLWKRVYKTSPSSWQRQIAQWVIVRVRSYVSVRGLAHAMTNFSSGGQPSLPFGTYCLGVAVQ